MAIIFGIVAAIAYGVSDFVGGLATKRAGAWPVVMWTQLLALVGAVAVTPFFGGVLTGRVVGWGVAAGVGTSVGSLALYQGLATGRMNVVAPLSGVVAAALPVLVGLGLGERLPTLVAVGIVIALVAIVLVSLSPAGGAAGRRVGSDAGFGILAGVGFALLFVGLQQAGRSSGTWPLVVTEAVAVCVVGGVVVLAHHPARLRGPAIGLTAVAGAAAFAATLLYLLATRHGVLAVVAVLVSLYPALTVILAAVVLHERSTRVQIVGMVAAAVAVAMIAVA